MQVRKARLQDASSVYDLVNSLSGDGTLLKRAFAEICENIRDFTVAESDGGIFLDACKDHTRAEFVQLAAEKEAAGDVPEQFR